MPSCLVLYGSWIWGLISRTWDSRCCHFSCVVSRKWFNASTGIPEEQLLLLMYRNHMKPISLTIVTRSVMSFPTLFSWWLDHFLSITFPQMFKHKDSWISEEQLEVTPNYLTLRIHVFWNERSDFSSDGKARNNFTGELPEGISYKTPSGTTYPSCKY